VSEWTEAINSRLSAVPFRDLVAALKTHLKSGGRGGAELTLGPTSVKIKLITARGSSTMSGTWG
jgi:hypothetical protein